MQQRILVIIGPTAVGKTELSLTLAEGLRGEIISADSMQVYRGMDIGTAKPSPAERLKVVHHLVDVVEPDQSFNVADYIQRAEDVLKNLKQRQVVPILAGGTGLYIDALLDGFLFPDTTADPEIRTKLQKKAEVEPASLYQELEQVDPESARKLHPNDLRRIIRALEVYKRSGESISVLQRKMAQEERPYKPLYIGLTRNRPELYERVDQRVDQMVASGLIEEVARLLDKYPEQPTALQALGYKEIAYYLQGQMELSEALELLKRDTRRYAKRQLSWFRRNGRIHWFNRSEICGQELVQSVLALWNSNG